MEEHFSIIKYFASSGEEPFFELNRIFLNDDHPQRNNLIYYMNTIEEEEIKQILSNQDYALFGKQIDSISWEDNAKLSYCKSRIPKEVNKLRMQAVIDETKYPPLPYDHPALSDIELDSNNMASLSRIIEKNRSDQLSDVIFQLLPSLPQLNSMYWVMRYLFELGNKCDVKVRLDPYMVVDKKSFSQMNYKMLVYGKPPDLKNMSSLKEAAHLRWMSDKYDSSDERFTDALWYPWNDEIHFICEEIPKPDCVWFRGSRYFHSIYDCKKNKINHLDGAIRIYTDDEINTRVNCHVKDIGKIGRRIKIFQADSEIDIELWSSLVASFFVWNDDVFKYFSN